MSDDRWLYFVLGVTAVISIGAVTNQIAPLTTIDAVVLSGTGITFPDGTIQTTAAGPADPRRAFYLTSSVHDGNEADGTDGDGSGVCAAGFHFASLWEILDVSNLRYAADVEGNGDVRRTPDSGHGPPSGSTGWIRTGVSNMGLSLSQEGFSNCIDWTADNMGDEGTTVSLHNNWALSVSNADLMVPWNSFLVFCNENRSVWCVEDYPGAAAG